MASQFSRLQTEKPEERQKMIVDVFMSTYGDIIQASPAAFRAKFRKMASTAFAFYRGSAVLFYADMAKQNDAYLDERTSRVWIQGDLHAENFGVYMNSAGILVFDVNDFDEAYVGPFTWDLKRLIASLALLGFEKALSDDEIRQIMRAFLSSYVAQMEKFATGGSDSDFALTLANTTGKLYELLQVARLNTRVALLDEITVVENYDRRLAINKFQQPLDPTLRPGLEVAFEQYLETIPERKRLSSVNYRIKDIVATGGVGIGSAGLKLYTFLLEGPTQTLENDVIISFKEARPAAPSPYIPDQRIKDYFLHDGHRTVLSQRALQAHADPWLGYTTFNGKGQLVAELSPYVTDMEWGGLNQVDDIVEMLKYMGMAVAKIHAVSDEDSDHTLVKYSTEEAVHNALKGREEQFINDMIAFGEAYGQTVRDDHMLFVDAFRNHMFPGL